MEHSDLVNQVFSVYAKNEPARALIGFLSKLPKSVLNRMVEDELRWQRDYRSMQPIYESLAVCEILQGRFPTSDLKNSDKSSSCSGSKG